MFMRNSAAALVIAAGLVVGGCAATGAPTVNTELQQEVQSAVSGNGRVLISVVDGVATLTGVVTDGTDRQAAEQVAMGGEGVTEVINLITLESE